MTDSAREVYDSVRVAGKYPKNVWRDDMVEAMVKASQVSSSGPPLTMQYKM